MIRVTDISEFPLSFVARSAAGNVTGTENPVWGTSDATILEIVPGGTPNDVIVRTTGKLGLAQVQLTVDAKIGEGEKPLAGLLEVEVVASEAVGLELTPGPVTDRPIPTP